MEPEAADAVDPMPARWHRIEELLLTERRMESRVERRNVWQRRQFQAGGADGCGGDPVVQRRELGQRLDAFQDPVVDTNRRPKPCPPVHYPVTNLLDRIVPPPLL